MDESLFTRLRVLVSVRFVMLGLSALLSTSGCSSLNNFGGSRDSAREWSAARGFSERIVQAGGFELTAFVRRPARAAESLTIYLEGDGAAWPSPYHPPRDPTPRKPMSLALAALDPAPAVAYLGRPCQYLDDQSRAKCSSTYWVEKRFAPEVIESLDLAVSQLKLDFAATRIRLIGYSGGGVIAALLALRRNDIDALITVASPLALGEWTRLKGLSALSGSIDPLFESGKLPAATHWIGASDDIVPYAVVERFARRKGGDIQRITGYDHDCCWTHDWPRFLKESP